MSRTYWESNSKNHDFSGFDQRGGQVAGLQAQFPCRVRRDNRRDALLSDGEFYLGQQSAEFHAHHAADELIPRSARNELSQGFFSSLLGGPAECVFRAGRRKPGNGEAPDCVQSARTQAFDSPVSRVMRHVGKIVHRSCSTSRQTILGHLSNEIGSGAKLFLCAWKYGISGW